MAIDYRRARSLLQELNLRDLFIGELNWANPDRGPFSVEARGDRYDVRPVAEQGGLYVFEVQARAGDGIPDRNTRKAIHRKIESQAFEHLLVYVNKPRAATLWSWPQREPGKAIRPNEHRFHVQQPGDSLLQRLEGLAFSYEDLDEEGKATIVQATDRTQAAFAINAERVTKRFYDEFQKQHAAFLKFIGGIERLDDQRWYASVMLNRLMFIYFVQKKGFLDGDPAYLANRFKLCQSKGVPYFRGFLVPLFFEGFATKPEERSPEARELLGDIPYLDGGLFMPHQIEQSSCGADVRVTGDTVAIDIPDEAFARIFEFFDRYRWHLDDRPLRADNEINPDVLGYIFEKYINQKQMGAYYTKEDITGYITRNTVLPFLFDKLDRLLKPSRPDAVSPLPIPDIEPYIYEAVRKGVDLPLPEHIAAGLDDVSKRTDWNRAADPEFALPTETWREHIARRKRYHRIIDDFAAGRIANINDFITYNLDIEQFAQDFVAEADDPLVIRAFYFDCLKRVTILDPTCGSGAFLFAALNMLEPLYELCLERMEEFLLRQTRHPDWATPFEMELAALAQHPSRSYFIYKSIIVNNLFGVDIMEEAVEICKLRLFLKLVAQVDEPDSIEPLPDIDFNILAGNTLVGYASLEEIEEAKAGKLDFGGILDRVRAVDRHISTFRSLQMEGGISAQHFRESKANVRARLRELEAELDRDLAFDYGHTKSADIQRFKETHKPFHWYVQFHDIMQHGGFEAIIGNPPYVEYSTVRGEYTVHGYQTEECGNLYAFVVERSWALLHQAGSMSFIMPAASCCTPRMRQLMDLLLGNVQHLWVSLYDERPAKLFREVDQQLSIHIARCSGECSSLHVTPMRHWSSAPSDERPRLFDTVWYRRVPPDARTAHVLPKIAEQTESIMLGKLDSVRSVSLGSLQRRGSSANSVYYRTAGGRYWKLVKSFPTYFRSDRRRGATTTENLLTVTREAVPVLVCLFSSSLFYWYWRVASNCRHLTKREMTTFPIAASLLEEASVEALTDLCDEFEASLRAHRAVKRTEGARSGRIVHHEYHVFLAKPIIDEIDRVLGEHYGFTEEELDFIINYDIKYRMGWAGGEPDEGPGAGPKRTDSTQGRLFTGTAPSAAEHEENSEEAGPEAAPTQHAPPADGIEVTAAMAAFRQAARGRGVIDREELLKEASVLLGYERLGKRIKQALRGRLRAAIRRGIIAAEGDEVWIATPTMADYERDDLVAALRSVMRKEQEYEREDVVHAVAIHLGFSRVTETVREPIRSAINAAIRRGIIAYHGSAIWRTD